MLTPKHLRPARLTRFAWLWLIALCLHAGDLTPLTIEELTEQSALIVHGTVLSKTTQRDDAGRIYTATELKVTEVWKGAHDVTRPLTIVQGGGTLGEERATVTHQVQYEIGEEVVAFLVLNSREQAVTLGLKQGKFHVQPGAAKGEKLVHNPFHGDKSTKDSSTKAYRLPNEVPLTLSALKQRVMGGQP
jgi:hypothetical protein